MSDVYCSYTPTFEGALPQFLTFCGRLMPSNSVKVNYRLSNNIGGDINIAVDIIAKNKYGTHVPNFNQIRDFCSM